ncbi:MAG: hypothetical protein IKE58_06290 [Blautia sp.]|nr:hypothetical protein [Blautia sp.]
MCNMKRNIPTGEANQEIAKIHDRNGLDVAIHDRESYFDTIFVRDVAHFMERAGMTRRTLTIALAPVMSDGQLYSLLNGNRRPSKRIYVIAIGVVLGLSVDDMNILLKDSESRGLDTKRSVGDTVIIYGLANKKNLADVNDMLHEVGAEYVLFD